MKNVWTSRGAAAGLIILLTFVAYIPALRGGFVFDDDSLIVNNRLIKASDGLYRFWCTTEPPDYYPMTWSLWWLEWRLWGGRPAGYHVVNVILHAVNAVLVWMILRRLGIRGAWLAALLFAVHPVNVATVAWVSEQKNTLSMLFYAGSILLYLHFMATNHGRWYTASLFVFLLALLSKPAVVMLPVVLLGCVWWQRGRIHPKDWWHAVPFFLLSLVAGLVTIWFQHNRAMEGITVRADGFFLRLSAAGWIPWFYLGKILLPVNLSVVYPQWEGGRLGVISYLPGVVLAGCLAWFWRYRASWGRPLLFGAGYFVATLFPVLGFVDQSFYGVTLVADHWQYFSMIGIIALSVGTGVVVCNTGGTWRRSIGITAGTGVAVVLGLATWARAGVYRNDETLWRDTIAKNPRAWVAYNGLGCALQQSNLTDAIAQYEQALLVRPDYAEAHNNLGNALLDLGKVTEAVAHFEQALQVAPNSAQVHYNLGGALIRLGKRSEAIRHWEQAVRIKPDYAEARNNLAAALMQIGRLPEAAEHFKEALRTNPDYAEAHNNLAAALLQTGRLPEAVEHLEQALRIIPDYAEAHYNLGVALEKTGKVEDAVKHYEQALRIKPDYTEAQKSLTRLRVVQ